jgi:hypothetical protein
MLCTSSTSHSLIRAKNRTHEDRETVEQIPQILLVRNRKDVQSLDSLWDLITTLTLLLSYRTEGYPTLRKQQGPSLRNARKIHQQFLAAR